MEQVENQGTAVGSLDSLSRDHEIFTQWNWNDYKPHYDKLIETEVNSDNLSSWMADWTQLSSRISETLTRYLVGTSCDTTDSELENRLNDFLEKVHNPAQAASQILKSKLLESGLQPKNFENPLREMLIETKLFREENLELFTEEKAFGAQYAKIVGAHTVEWEGQEVTLKQLAPVSQDSDRAKRERAWRLASERELSDRSALNDLWQQCLQLRTSIASNAGYSDYTAYKWDDLHRFDYTPSHCEQFRDAIEQVVVPAAARILEKRREALGLETLRPWDLHVDTDNQTPLAPFSTGDELAQNSSKIFHHVDPQVGEYFDIMIREGLLDLENRKGKGPGGFCTTFPTTKRPFIFMNAVGLQTDVRTMLHEAGHAFHAFEKLKLPYAQQRVVGAEFNEVASMAMELLCAPYLTHEYGGFYTDAEAARSRIQHLENIILFWPYMAVVDGFQHWAYANPKTALDPAECDSTWSSLWDRFMPVVDWTGLEEIKITGWHRKLHIFKAPFYYVEYGLAQLGAVQIWANAQENQAEAVSKYLDSLVLGGTVALPKLYEAAGVKFAFDRDTLSTAVELLESVITELQSQT